MTQNKKILNLVQATLNIRHSLKLTEEISIPSNSNIKIKFDLGDISNRTFVEILKDITVDKRDIISNKINELSSIILNSNIKSNLPLELKIISEDILSDTERKFYHNQFKENNRIRYEFLDIVNILNFAESFKKDLPFHLHSTIEEFNNEINLYKKKTNQSENSKKNDIILNDINEIHNSKTKKLFFNSFQKFQGTFWWINASDEMSKASIFDIGYDFKYPKSNINSNRLKSNVKNFNVGDIVISFTKDNRLLDGVYQVIKSFNDENIVFKLIYKLPIKLSWSELEIVEGFKNSIIWKAKNQNSAYELNSELFIEILIKSEVEISSLIENIDGVGIGLIHGNTESNSDFDNENNRATSGMYYNPSKIAELYSDSINGEDHFKINSDITAFAKVIASKSFQPPLAVALFGKWGMGKSFFMNSLMEKIINYSKSQEKIEKPVYCIGIAHIHFNAWSYMDSNLWASLVSKIFEGLDEYIGNDNATDDEKNIIKKELSGQLELIKEQREILELNKNENETQIVTLKEQKFIKENVLKEKLNELKKKSIKDVIQEVDNEFDVAKELKDSFIENIPEHFKQKPDLALAELNSNRFFISQLLNRKNLFAFIVIIIFTILLSWFIPFIILKIAPKISSAVTYISQGIVIILSIVIPIWNGIYTTYKKLQPFINKVWKIKIEYDLKLNDELRKFKDEQDCIENNILNIENELKTIDNQIFNTQLVIKSIDFKLNNNLSTLAMHSFIEKRLKSADYHQHLGIVSTIRKDFEILSDLFLESKSENQLNKPLERIVLYIDDLDRCPEDRVIEVLEAVNLLMAFPLFVVVVGVDPRWVNNALLKKYQLQFGENKAEGYERINASDYLEKIFQVPFHLKQAEDSDVKNMLKKLTENSIKKEIESQDSNFDFKEKDIAQLDTVQLSDEQLTMGGSTESHQFIINDEPRKIDTHLSLRPKEIELMQDFSLLIGNNPRTIKRFVNTYQIIRAHEEITINTLKDNIGFLEIMFLLALSIGPFKSANTELELFLDSENINLAKFLYNYEDKNLENMIRKMKNSNQLLGFQPKNLKKHNQFIKRFTFSY